MEWRIRRARSELLFEPVTKRDANRDLECGDGCTEGDSAVMTQQAKNSTYWRIL